MANEYVEGGPIDMGDGVTGTIISLGEGTAIVETTSPTGAKTRTTKRIGKAAAARGKKAGKAAGKAKETPKVEKPKSNAQKAKDAQAAKKAKDSKEKGKDDD